MPTKTKTSSKTPVPELTAAAVSEPAVEESLPTRLSASIDVAHTTDDNYRQWQYADGLSADAAYSPQVRDILRRRARYEFINNSICKGIVRTFVNDVVGRGPLLQMKTGNKRKDQKIEKAWKHWVRAVHLPRKLRTKFLSRIVSGEGLGILAQNPRVMHPVQLDLQLIECDRLQNPYDFQGAWDPSSVIDGIDFDFFGNPVQYMILNQHPGNLVGLDLTATAYPSQYVLHNYSHTRPEQHRGIPDITQALPLFADLRRYTAAVIAAAETAADFSAVMESQNMPETGPVKVAAMDLVPIEKRMMTTLPQGWKLTQLRAEQPTNVYAAFKREIVAETCRCLNIPYVAGAADASGHNFSSAKLDWTGYNVTIDVERQEIEEELDRVLFMFIQDLRFVDGFRDVPQLYDHEWLWTNRPSSDPRDAGANQTKLQSMQTTFAEFWAGKGKDWVDVVDEIAEEIAYMKKKGLTPEQIMQVINVERMAEGAPELDDEEEDLDEE